MYNVLIVISSIYFVICLHLVLCTMDKNATTVINIYSNLNISDDGSAISECIAETSHYYVISNQSVTVKLQRNLENAFSTECETPLKVTFVNLTYSQEMRYLISSPGQKNSQYCALTLKQNAICYVHSGCSKYAIFVTDFNTNNHAAIQDNTSGTIYADLTFDLNSTNTMRDVTYRKNSNLFITCTDPDPTSYKHIMLIIKDKKKIEILKPEEYSHGLSHFYMDESLNGMELVCVVGDKRTNKTLKAGITLRYENKLADTRRLSIIWISAITVVVLALGGATIAAVRLYFKSKDKLHLRSSTARNEESRTSVENEYDFIYDDVYENRRRLEREAQEALHKSKPEEETPPTPPPIDTIPALNVEKTRLLKRYSMLTPASDLYLLQIDSEGYQIPEEVHVRGIQLDQNIINKRK